MFPSNRVYPDHVATGNVGKDCATASETRRSTDVALVEIGEGSRPGENAAIGWLYVGFGWYAVIRDRQPGQINGSASGRDDIGPDLLQRYDVTGLCGLDGEERRDGNQRTGEGQGTQYRPR